MVFSCCFGGSAGGRASQRSRLDHLLQHQVAAHTGSSSWNTGVARLHQYKPTGSLTQESVFQQLSLQGVKRYTKFEVEAALFAAGEPQHVGSGSFGSVFRATLDGLDVAVKVFKTTSQSHHFYLHELHVLSQLKHEALVALVGYCTDPEALVFEFYEGGTLSERLKYKAAPLPWQQRLAIAAELAEGLEYAHSPDELAVVHMDFKPGNVLLDRQGCANISDFGLAELLDVQEVETGDRTWSRAGSMAGVSSSARSSFSDGSADMRTSISTLLQGAAARLASEQAPPAAKQAQPLSQQQHDDVRQLSDMAGGHEHHGQPPQQQLQQHGGGRRSMESAQSADPDGVVAAQEAYDAFDADDVTQLRASTMDADEEEFEVIEEALQPGRPLGTTGYIDPAMRKLGTISPAVDVYAYGIVLCQLLTACKPFVHMGDRSAPAVSVKVLVATAAAEGQLAAVLDRRAGTWPAGVAERVAAIALSCCEDERELRPDMGTVARKLRRLERQALNGSSISSVPSSVKLADSVA